MAERENEAESQHDEVRDDDADANGDERGFGQRLEGLVPEMLRRAFSSSVGAFASSEEGIRKLATEFKLPRELANYLINQAQGSRDEMLRIMGNEIRRFFESLDLHDELQRLLTSLSFEIKTEIRFIPNDAQPARPKITQKIKVKRQKRPRKDDSGEAADNEPAGADGADAAAAAEPSDE